MRSANTAGDFNDWLSGFRQLGVQVIGVGIDREVDDRQRSPRATTCGIRW